MIQMIQDDFGSISDFSAYFKDEEVCLAYLEQMRWGDDVVCPRCKSGKAYRFTDKIRFKCSACQEHFTVKTGTAFGETKIPLLKWFFAIYLFTKEGSLSSTKLSKTLKITQKSAWYMIEKIKNNVSNNQQNESEKSH